MNIDGPVVSLVVLLRSGKYLSVLERASLLVNGMTVKKDKKNCGTKAAKLGWGRSTKPFTAVVYSSDQCY